MLKWIQSLSARRRGLVGKMRRRRLLSPRKRYRRVKASSVVAASPNTLSYASILLSMLSLTFFLSNFQTKMVQCPDAHLFCSDCVTAYASTQLGAHDVNILCMDQSGCKHPFPESELRRLLSPKLMELYERVKQRKEIEAAGLDGLEECPFCEYKCVIENPNEKLFRCGNEETCGAITCRSCKKVVRGFFYLSNPTAEF